MRKRGEKMAEEEKELCESLGISLERKREIDSIEIMVSDVPRDEYNQPSSFFDRCYAESRYHDYHKDNRVEDTE